MLVMDRLQLYFRRVVRAFIDPDTPTPIQDCQGEATRKLLWVPKCQPGVAAPGVAHAWVEARIERLLRGGCKLKTVQPVLHDVPDDTGRLHHHQPNWHDRRWPWLYELCVRLRTDSGDCVPVLWDFRRTYRMLSYLVHRVLSNVHDDTSWLSCRRHDRYDCCFARRGFMHGWLHRDSND